MKIPDTKKLAVIGVIVAIVVLFFALNLQQYMNLEYIKESRENFQVLLAQHPLLITGAFFVIYIVVTALSLPGAAVMTLAGGALFGFWAGLIIVSFASSIGATLACAVARYLFRDWTKEKMGAWYHKINAGIKKEGGFYLFTLRLIPAVPFFAINLGMALTGMRLWTFYWVSQVGMLAGTAVYINAGNQLGQIRKMGDILSPWLIISFVILGIFPLAVKKIVNFVRAKIGKVKVASDT
jgi:uncharacterized membrane protein YdjX (TVP38/TMEM64 family)